VNRFHGDRGITRPKASTTKRFGLVAVGLGSNQFTVGGATPEIGAAGMEEGARQGTKRLNELAGLAALESSAGKLQEQLLEILFRLRRVPQPRVSSGSRQRTPFLMLNN
jgi:hypothetical protein